MVPVISVVGRSNSGKTTFLEKLIAELTHRGHRVASIKHDTHGFDVDKPGKDSWRLARAGSKAVAISSPQKVAIMREVTTELTLDDLAFQVGADVDIVLTEGYKRGDRPKIEVFRREVSTALLCSPDELLALVTDQRQPVDVPQFDLEDAAKVADLIEERFLRRPPSRSVTLVVDGRDVLLKGFVVGMLDRPVRALVSLLEGCENAKEITLRLKDD